jgi:hypothetical protein
MAGTPYVWSERFLKVLTWKILILQIEDRPDAIVPHHVQQCTVQYTEAGAHYRQVLVLPSETGVDVSMIT